MGAKVITILHWHRAKKKSKKPTVVFVHHMWGSYKTTKRHQIMVKDWGYDCVSFDLLFGSSEQGLHWNKALLKFTDGVFAIWQKQIHQVLDQIPGEKILFCFSGPSLSGLRATAQRDDVIKIICDGGPFTQIYNNTKNFFQRELKIEQPLSRALLARIAVLLWGVRPLSRLEKTLRNWPHYIPILSIRGLEDPIVKIESIEEVFQPHNSLPLSVFNIPGGGHIDGLKKFPDFYRSEVDLFLNSVP